MLRLSMLFFMLGALCAGCGDSDAASQAISRKITEATKEMTAILANVHDKPTAEAAALKVQELADRVEKLTDALEETEDEDMGEDLDTEEMREAVGQHIRLMQEIARIGQIPKAREGLGSTWTELTGGAYFSPGAQFQPGTLAPAMTSPDSP